MIDLTNLLQKEYPSMGLDQIQIISENFWIVSNLIDLKEQEKNYFNEHLTPMQLLKNSHNRFENSYYQSTVNFEYEPLYTNINIKETETTLLQTSIMWNKRESLFKYLKYNFKQSLAELRALRMLKLEI